MENNGLLRFANSYIRCCLSLYDGGQEGSEVIHEFNKQSETIEAIKQKLKSRKASSLSDDKKPGQYGNEY